MGLQKRLHLVMTKQDAIKVACRELEASATNWFMLAQSANPNYVTKHDREMMFQKSQECKQAAQILEENNESDRNAKAS